VDGARQRGQGVDRAGLFSGHLVPRDHQYARGHPCPVGGNRSRSAEFSDLQTQNRSSHPDRIRHVALAGPPPVVSRHLRRLHDLQPGAAEPIGQDRAIGADALDDHQGQLVGDAADDPAVSAGQPCRGAREHHVVNERARRGGDEGQGVGGGVGIHADDELVLL